MVTAVFDGLKGLLTAEPAAVATELLVCSFQGRSGKLKSDVAMSRLAQNLGELGGVPVFMVQLHGQDDRLHLRQLTLECCLFWEWALLAARPSEGDSGAVSLLRLGTSLLSGKDPAFSIHPLLAAVQR